MNRWQRSPPKATLWAWRSAGEEVATLNAQHVAVNVAHFV